MTRFVVFVRLQPEMTGVRAISCVCVMVCAVPAIHMQEQQSSCMYVNPLIEQERGLTPDISMQQTARGRTSLEDLQCMRGGERREADFCWHQSTRMAFSHELKANSITPQTLRLSRLEKDSFRQEKIQI